ncbi:MAG: VanZ family protein [Coprobacillus sp.]
MKKRNVEKIVLYIIFILYICILVKIVLLKNLSLMDLLNRDIVTGYHSINLIPFQTIIDFITMGNGQYLRIVSNVLGNIAIFVPLGYLFPILFSKIINKFKMTIIVFGFSLCFESMQYVLYLGTFDIDDLLLNTIGGLIGYLIYRIVYRHSTKEVGFYRISIGFCCILFAFGFIAAKEEFGNLLGLTSANIETIGDNSIPKEEANYIGEYISYDKGIVSFYNNENIAQLKTVKIEDDTDLYIMTNKEVSNNNIQVKYDKITSNEISTLLKGTRLKVWQINNHIDVIVFIPSTSKTGEVAIEDNNYRGIIENINQDGFSLNIIKTEEMNDGSSIGISGRGEYANLIQMKCTTSTKYILNNIKNNKDIISSHPCAKTDLKVGDIVVVKVNNQGFVDEVQVNRSVN